MRTHLWLFLFCFAVAAAGCARPPKPKIDNVYRGLSENLPRLDPRLLSGRRVVIDPGHGGHFAGTRGQNGLEESAVNLGVSLYLWGLLREAGADVYLTRSAERDFLAGPDSTSTADLQVRAGMIDSIRPDILVSIHHNAEPGRDPAKNAVETYYKMNDPASRDLAFAVHRHLTRNLGMEEGEVRGGSYYILRTTDAPAILGEASYLTHPMVEEKLELSGKQRLEAEAYFLGILEYFSRGTPVIEDTAAGADSLFTEAPVLSYAVSDIGGIGIDPGRVEMTVNGTPVSPSFDPSGAKIHYRLPWDAPNGRYDISIVAENLLGNSSRAYERSFLLSCPAKRAVFSCYPEDISSSGGTVYFRIRLLDSRGLSVAEGSHVKIAAWCRRGEKSDWAACAGSGAGTPRESSVTGGVVEFPVDVTAGSSAVRVAVLPYGDLGMDESPEGPVGTSGFEFILRTAASGVRAGRTVVLVDSATRTPVSGAEFAGPEGLLSSESRCDRYVIPSGLADQTPVWVHATGYRPSVLTPAALDTLVMDRWYDGKLAGKRYVVNPTGSGAPNGDRGRLGLSGSYVGLQVARYLQEYLETGGGIVRLARTTEETPPERDVVVLTNRFRADQYIEIRYRAAPADTARAVRAFYFPGSQRGLATATAVADAASEVLGVPVVPPVATVTFPLQQTACPAIIVEPANLGSIAEELRLSSPCEQRRQAYAIFCGVIRDGGVTANSTTVLHVVVVADSLAPAPSADVSNWLVTVDDSWRLLTSADGVAAFECLPPGPHRVDVRRGERWLGPFDTILDPGQRRVVKAVLPQGQ